MDEEILFEGTVEDQQAAILKKMSEVETTSKDFRDLSDVFVKLNDSKNATDKIDNEAEAKREERELEREKIKLEKKKLKYEKKKIKQEKKLREEEIKSQKRAAIITAGATIVVGAITGFVSGYSTKMNRKNLEDTLNFEKTGIVRSAGHKHVSKKG